MLPPCIINVMVWKATTYNFPLLIRRGDVREGWEKLAVTSWILGTDFTHLYDFTHVGLESEVKSKTISQEMKLRIFQRRENKTSSMSGQEHWGRLNMCLWTLEWWLMHAWRRQKYIHFSLHLSLCIMRYRNLWALRQKQKKKKRHQEDGKIIPQFPLRCGMWEPGGRDQQVELSTERHRCGSLSRLASLRSTEEEHERRNVRPCIQKSTLGRHSCEDCWFIRGQEAEQVWREWDLCCWQFCCALCCYKAIRKAGQKGIGALWHCLNERKLCKGPAGG